MEACNKTFAKINKSTYNQKLFIEVRQAAMLRLIFFNGRRPAEVANLKIIEWNLAKNDHYLTQSQKKKLKKIQDSDKMLNQFKSSDVLIIIPRNLWVVLEFLCNLSNRITAEVHELNEFVFPSTKRSLECSEGTFNIKQYVPELEMCLTTVQASIY